jgi:peptidyl-prolyl cis-trans isomerase SurA
MSDSKLCFSGIVCLLAAISLNLACRSTPATPATPPTPAVSADTWAVVNGHQITSADVDKAYRRAADASQALSDEETLTAKLNLLDSLVLQEILLSRARTLNLTVATNDLDTAYGDAKKNVDDATFQQELKKRGLTPEDMREALRRELLTQKVLDTEVSGKISVTDQDITDFFNTHRAEFNVAEESYHLAQIVVTPVREPQVANSTGDDAATPQAAMAKVRMLMERLQAGASFRDLAVSYSEDPESAPRGGDLGLVPLSRLKQAPAPLRDAVLNKAPGSVNVASAGGSYTLVLVVAHEAAGQRDLSTPGVREDITQAIRSRKDQLLRSAYLAATRSDASVVNYMARRVVESNGKMPTAQPSLMGR